MKKVDIKDFQRDILKYVKLAENEEVMVTYEGGRGFYITPADNTESDRYSWDFVQSIRQAEQERKEGKTTIIYGETELKEFLDSL